jgi:hypothetical protein
VPYAVIYDAERTWHTFSTHETKERFFGAWLLTLHREFDSLDVMATMWLPPRQLSRLRRLIRGRAAKARRAAAEADVLDPSPPYPAVRKALRAAAGGYPLLDSDADDLADVLRERPLTLDDLGDVLDEHYDGLLERLNAAGGY